METKDLMSPRFEVIADYPKSSFKVGEVLINVEHATVPCVAKYGDCIRYNTLDLTDIVFYPHIFKKLKWWEKRALDELPGFVKRIDTKTTLKMKGKIIEVGRIIKIPIEDYLLEHFVPSTEKDFNQQEP